MTDTAAHETFWFLNNHVTVGVSKAESADGISVLRLLLPFDEAPPTHVHHAEDEIFHVIRGEARFMVGGKTVTASAGDTVLGPRGIPHGFRVTSRDGAEFLTVTRGGFEDMVRQMARPASRQAPPEPAPPTHEEQARLAEICQMCNIELLGPPIN